MPEENTPDPGSGFGVDIEADLPESVDRAAVRRMRTAAYLLDESIRVPGTGYRVGIDPVIGVLPVAGDLVSGALSMYIVLESARLGVSTGTLVKMVANVSLDVIAGSVPYVGDLFDAAWKANRRNVELALADLATDTAADRGGGGTRIDIE